MMSEKREQDVLDKQGCSCTDDGTKQRIKKLEAAIHFLFGLFLGQIIGRLLGQIIGRLLGAIFFG